MDVVPAPDGTWAVIPKRLQEAISLLRMNELAGVPKNKPRSPAPPEAPKNPIRDTERNPPPGEKPKKNKDDSQGNPADENRVDEGEKWIQDAEEDIDRRGTEGVCTGKKFGGPTCREGTKRYNLAKTFRKMAKKRKGKKR